MNRIVSSAIRGEGDRISLGYQVLGRSGREVDYRGIDTNRTTQQNFRPGRHSVQQRVQQSGWQLARF
jgi:hypothetical protein